MIRSNKIRASARLQDCTLNIAGICNYDASTTVLAHLPDESHGMGLKADDICSCYACSACHDAIDGRSGVMDEAEKEWYMRRAMVRTIRKLVEQGLITIK